MKLFTALAALTLIAAPVQSQSFPVWADLVGESACTYLAMGVDVKTSALQAVSDNLLWKEEMTEAHNRGLLDTIIAGATAKNCPSTVDAVLSSNN